MVDIGQSIVDLFTGLGLYGLLLAVFFIFYLDAILFPTLPELFVIIIFLAGQQYVPGFEFAILILITIALAEVAGILTLYSVVIRVKLPARIERAIHKYRDFLVVRDERMILVNRIAPILPFLGAFAAICKWSLRKTIIYTVIGGTIKYGLILAMAGYLFYYFEAGVARTATLIMVIVIIGISFGLSYYRKKKMEDVCEDRPA
jgi:membrane protein YqaA with SNARE-associated domain